MPNYDATLADLQALDTRVRNMSAEDVLVLQDQDTLAAIGFERTDFIALHDAWQRLRNRRHRKTPEPIVVEDAQLLNDFH